MVIELDFAWLDLQGRGAKGSTLTAHKVDRVVNAPKDSSEEIEGGVPEKKEQTKPKVLADKKKLDSVKEINLPVDTPSPKGGNKTTAQSKDPRNQATFEF